MPKSMIGILKDLKMTQQHPPMYYYYPLETSDERINQVPKLPTW
jgi:hypothetical protein